MKKITLLLLVLAGICFADGLVTLLDIDTGEQSKKIAIGVPSTAQQTAQLAAKLSITNITQTVTDSATEVPSGAAVRNVIDPYGVAGGTNYLVKLSWDATNKVFIVTETAQ